MEKSEWQHCCEPKSYHDLKILSWYVHDVIFIQHPPPFNLSRVHESPPSVISLSCICLSPPLFTCADEAHETAPTSPSQCGSAASPRALQKAHMAYTNTRQSQAHRGGYHRLCGEHDAASSAGHVQQDGQSRCSPGPAEPGVNEARVGHPSCAREVSLY